MLTINMAENQPGNRDGQPPKSFHAITIPHFAASLELNYFNKCYYIYLIANGWMVAAQQSHRMINLHLCLPCLF